MRIDILNMKYIVEDKRLDGSFFLNDYALNSRLVQNHSEKCKPLSVLANAFNPPVFKRQFCQKTERAVPYCQSSNVTNLLDGSDIFINKIQAKRINAIVKENQILVTGFGTIGNCRLVNSLSEGIAYANNVCRIEAKENQKFGYLYGFLCSKYGIGQLNKNASGSVVRYIEAPGIKKILIPIFPEPTQDEIHKLIVDAANLRVEANKLIALSQQQLKKEANLIDLTNNEYEYFGIHPAGRKVSTFIRNRLQISSITINAFNYSKRVEDFTKRIYDNNVTQTLYNVLDENKIFSTGSFPRVELKSPKSILLINQSDIFNIKMQGKHIARKKVKTNNLVNYGEVLIAGVGTLGENETFCRVMYAGEELEGELVSGEFLRLKTNKDVPSGYLFAWLSTDYGFRLIRSTQTGTKLCRPIQELLLKIPVPILDKRIMQLIDEEIQSAFKKRFQASKKENMAISMIEKTIESWQN